MFATSRQPSILNIDAEESVSYFLERHGSCPIYGHMDFLLRPKQVSLQVTGDKQGIFWDYYGGKLASLNQGSMHRESIISKIPFDRNQMFVDVVNDFLKAAKSRHKPMSDLTDGLAALLIVEGVKESIVSGRRVEITH